MSRSRLSVRTAVGDALALGFRRPVSVTVWGLASILCLVGTFALLDWGFAGFDLGRSEAPFDPHSLGEMLRFQGASGLINLATLGFTAVLLAAATRAGLGWPHGRSLAFMQIGLDEFRVLVIQVAMGVGAYFLLIPLVLIGVGVGLAVWPLEPVVRGQPRQPLADRIERRRLMQGTQTFAMILALLLAALVLTDVVQVWHVLVIAAMRGIFMSLNMPTRQALISDIVGREHLMNAIALNSVAVEITVRSSLSSADFSPANGLSLRTFQG